MWELAVISGECLFDTFWKQFDNLIYLSDYSLGTGVVCSKNKQTNNININMQYSLACLCRNELR